MSIFEALKALLDIGLITKQEYDKQIQSLFDEAGI